MLRVNGRMQLAHLATAPRPCRSSALDPEEVWQEPVDRLLDTAHDDPGGPCEHRGTIAAGDLRTQRRRDRQAFTALAAVPRRFRNPLVIILLVASALSAANGDVASFVIIIFIVTLSITMDFVQEARAQNAVEALRRSVAVQATVRRDGAKPSLPLRPTGPRRHCRTDRRRSRSGRFAAARKPRPVCQPGAADGRALSSREAAPATRRRARKILLAPPTPCLPARR